MVITLKYIYFKQTLVPSNPIIAFLYCIFYKQSYKYLNKLSACLELNFAYYILALIICIDHTIQTWKRFVKKIYTFFCKMIVPDIKKIIVFWQYIIHFIQNINTFVKSTLIISFHNKYICFSIIRCTYISLFSIQNTKGSEFCLFFLKSFFIIFPLFIYLFIFCLDLNSTAKKASTVINDSSNRKSSYVSDFLQNNLYQWR